MFYSDVHVDAVPTVSAMRPQAHQLFLFTQKKKNLELFHMTPAKIGEGKVMNSFRINTGTQLNSSCSHCAVTGQWRCGDYPLTH